jgi:hypothetical protein
MALIFIAIDPETDGVNCPAVFAGRRDRGLACPGVGGGGRIVGDGNRRFTLLVEEEVLRHRIGGHSVMAGQLARLLDATQLPAVVLGVVPFSADRPMWPLEAFTVFDDERVVIELLSAQVTVTTPSEITLYVRAFERLGRLAVYGDAARVLVADAIAALG